MAFYSGEWPSGKAHGFTPHRIRCAGFPRGPLVLTFGVRTASGSLQGNLPMKTCFQ